MQILSKSLETETYSFQFQKQMPILDEVMPEI